MSASDELAAITVFSAERRTFRIIGEEFAGLLLGQWAPLGPAQTMRGKRFIPAGHVVEGTRLFTAELNAATRLQWVVREPAIQPRTVALPRGVSTTAVAGDLFAYAQSKNVIVKNWRTGAEVARYPVAELVQWLDVRADGALVTADSDGNVVERVPGAAPRRLTRNGAGPTFAGDRVVFIARTGRLGVLTLNVAEPDGRVRPFGVPSAALTDFVADEQRVLWRGNGCLLSAPITEPAADAPDAGACPRGEVQLPDEFSRPVRRDRRVRFRMYCVAAAPPGCRGTLALRPAWGARGRLARPLRFQIAVGRRAHLKVRLTRRGYQAALRSHRRIGGAPAVVRTVTLDPDGGRRVQEHRLMIDVR